MNMKNLFKITAIAALAFGFLFPALNALEDTIPVYGMARKPSSLIHFVRDNDEVPYFRMVLVNREGITLPHTSLLDAFSNKPFGLGWASPDSSILIFYDEGKHSILVDEVKLRDAEGAILMEPHHIDFEPGNKGNVGYQFSYQMNAMYCLKLYVKLQQDVSNYQEYSFIKVKLKVRHH